MFSPNFKYKLLNFKNTNQLCTSSLLQMAYLLANSMYRKKTKVLAYESHVHFDDDVQIYWIIGGYRVFLMIFFY